MSANDTPDETAWLERIRKQADADAEFYLSRKRTPPPRLLETILLIAEIDRLTARLIDPTP